MTEEKKGQEDKNSGETNGDSSEDFGSQHLNDALSSFRKGLSSLGLFCTEQAIPAAEQAAKEGLRNVEDVLAKAREAVDEAFQKARDEFSNDKDDNDSTPGQK